MAARQRGAKAMLVVTGPRSPNAGETVPMTFDTALAGSGIVAASISGTVADAIFAAIPDKTLEAAQKSLDSANPHATGFALPDVDGAPSTTAVEREKRTGHNVVAYLPATMPVGTAAKPWVALGAHYDHLGHGEAGNSLAGKDEAGKIHFGADDNASGSRPCSRVAATLAGQPRQRNVIVRLLVGRGAGADRIGAFAAAPPVPLDQLAAYLNFDMVGRMQDNKLTIQAAGTSPVWARIIEQANVAAGFDLQVQADPYQPTDVATFNAASVPCLSFFTGTHADYHKPTDTADKIDYDDLDRVVDFAAAIVRRLGDTAEAPAVHQGRSGACRRRRPRRRAHLHRDDSRLLHRRQRAAAGRRHRRRAGRAGGAAEGRRHRRNRRPDDRQHLRLHLRARRAEDRPAGEGRLHARRQAHRDDADPSGPKVASPAIAA